MRAVFALLSRDRRRREDLHDGTAPTACQPYLPPDLMHHGTHHLHSEALRLVEVETGRKACTVVGNSNEHPLAVTLAVHGDREAAYQALNWSRS